MKELALFLALLAVPVIAEPAHSTTTVDLFYADRTDGYWPVADQMRRWDRSIRITLAPVADCADAPGPCVTILSAPEMPAWLEPYPDGTKPRAAFWADWTVDPLVYAETPGRSTIIVTTTQDAQLAQIEATTGRPIIAVMRAGTACHEIGHWLIGQGDEMHAVPYGCLSNVGTPWPGRRARALIPDWS